MTRNGGYRGSLGALRRVAALPAHHGDLRGRSVQTLRWGNPHTIGFDPAWSKTRAINDLDDWNARATHLGSEKRFPLLPSPPDYAHLLADW
jgi:hypothetical protein